MPQMHPAQPAPPAPLRAAPTPVCSTPAPAPSPTGSLRISGTLVRDAEHRHTRGHHADQESHALVLALISTGVGLPIEVVQDLGTGPAAHIAAASKAGHLRRGTMVTAVAHGASPRVDHGHAVLRAHGLTDLIHDLTHDAHHPAGSPGKEH